MYWMLSQIGACNRLEGVLRDSVISSGVSSLAPEDDADDADDDDETGGTGDLIAGGEG